MEKLYKKLNNTIANEKNIHIKYSGWIKFLLRRANEVGKVELPISAIILDERGRCIGRGSNRRQIDKDPLGHAELIALRQAAWIRRDWRFNGCTLIVNLEPCQMCAGALVQSRMSTVIYTLADKKRGGLGGTIDLSKHISSHHKMNVIKGPFEKESRELIQSWFKKLRKVK